MKTSNNKRLAKHKADKYFSLYIRERDKGKPCITCGRYSSKMDCGHFISRRFEATRYDEKNANAQCIKCNRFENGNQFEHGQNIDHKYGSGTAEHLHFKSKMKCYRKKYDYEYIAMEYKKKYDEIK